MVDGEINPLSPDLKVPVVYPPLTLFNQYVWSLSLGTIDVAAC